MTKKRNTRSKASIADILLFVLCSLGAVAALGLYYKDINSWSLKNNEVAVAKIYFKKNVVQRKFIDNDIWERVNQESPIYNGDKIRTAQDSEIHAQFEKTGTKIQLKENSLIQIFSNKKEKAIDFLSGEILLASAQDGEEAVITAVKKKISAAPNSKVKITISKAEKNEKKESLPTEAVVEVIEGEAQVTNVPVKQAIFQKPAAEEETQTITAGEQFVVTEEPIEAEPEPAQSEPVPAAEEETPQIEEEPQEAESVSESKPESLKAEEAEEEDGEEAAAASPAPKAEPKEPVQIEKNAVAVVESPSMKFAKNVYNQKTGEYNYGFGVILRKLFGTKRIIPAGSVVELKIRGVPNKNVPAFALDVSGANWQKVSATTIAVPNAGKGLLAGIPFNERICVYIQKEISSTNQGNIYFSYDINKLDEEVEIKDFKVEAKILSLDADEIISQIPVGKKSLVTIDKIQIKRVKWDHGDSGFTLYLPAQRILGYTKSLPKGAKIKINLSAQSSLPLSFVGFNTSNCDTERWTRAQEDTLNDGSIGQEFSLEKIVTLKDSVKNSDAAVMEISFSNNKKEEFCELTNLRFAFERVE
ncbi:MAG: hypothetical protein J6V90_00770 [Treponema sp.]|nr:hypothetical protein [Treponema sp.]